METPLLQPLFQCSHALHCCGTHGPCAEDVKGDSIRIEKKVRCKKLQQRLGDLVATVLLLVWPISGTYGQRCVWWFVVGLTIGLNQCSDLIDELLLVREMTQVAPRASQCSAVVLPFARALPCLPLYWLLLTYDSYCYNAMMYWSFVDLCTVCF